MRPQRVSPLLQYALVAFIGVMAGILVMIFVRSQSYVDVNERLDRRAEQLAVSVQQSVDAKLQVLQAFQAFYAVDGVVNGDEFKKFAVVTLTYHRDIQALQWIPHIDADELEAFEAMAREIYGDDFFVKARNADGVFVPVEPRDYYFPILFTEPLEGNEAVLGLDAAFEPTRRKVIEAAWFDGTVAVSDPIRLVQETGEQMAVLIYQPIYGTTPPPENEAERRAMILGLVPVVLRTGDFMMNSLRNFDTSGFEITMIDPGAPEIMLYRLDDDGGSADDPMAVSITRPIMLANHIWHLNFDVSEAQIETQIRFNGIVAFTLVVALDLALIVYLWQRNRAEEALRGYAATLEETNRELDAYNHTIAHDLKSPLAIINGYAYLLQDEKLSPDGERMMETIPKVVDNMVEMIDGLLQLAKIRDPGATMTTVDMDAALKKAAERFDNAKEYIKVEGELPPARGHAPWMMEVFANLISNAIKYTPEDRTPEIRVRGTRTDKHVRYEVSDNGIGIKPEDQQRIFEMFTRIFTEDFYTQKGLGIGLSIVQRVIRRSGGEVGVTSEPGKGSTFWFTLDAPEIP